MRKNPVKKEIVFKIVPPALTVRCGSTVSTEFGWKDDRVEESVCEKQIIAGSEAQHTTIQNVIFDGVVFQECNWKGVHFNDVRFVNCDLSNILLPQSIFYRVEFESCKLLGANLIESTFNHVKLQNCNLRYANLSGSRFRSALFQESDLQQAFLESCKLDPARFDKCNLREGEFSYTSLKGVDLRSNEVEGIRLNLADLKGAVTTSIQAVQLASLLGIIIKETE